MRNLATLMLLFFATTLRAAAPTTPEQEMVTRQLKGRDARLVTVLTRGLYYHRHDHLLLTGVEQITPEAAQARLFSRCPECLPPISSSTLTAETPTDRKLSRYYGFLLTERVKPTTTALPPGSLQAGSAKPAGPASGAPQRQQPRAK
ncbi:MAG: hypothetical protein HY815_29275 [Candidatus Riflebacteria bacterium]|nr:hypothetical protein [Candidatus Riflebacteria bacterium]